MEMKWSDLIPGDKLRLSKEYIDKEILLYDSWLNNFSYKHLKNGGILIVIQAEIDTNYITLLLKYDDDFKDNYNFHIKLDGSPQYRDYKFSMFEIVELV